MADDLGMLSEMAASANLNKEALIKWAVAKGLTASRILNNVICAKIDYAPRWDALHIAVVGLQGPENECYVAITRA